MDNTVNYSELTTEYVETKNVEIRDMLIMNVYTTLQNHGHDEEYISDMVYKYIELLNECKSENSIYPSVFVHDTMASISNELTVDTVPIESIEDDIEYSYSIDSYIMQEELKSLLNLTMQCLRDNEMAFLTKYCCDNMSFREVGKEYDLSGSRVHQVVRKAERKMRHPSRSTLLSDFYNDYISINDYNHVNRFDIEWDHEKCVQNYKVYIANKKAKETEEKFKKSVELRKQSKRTAEIYEDIKRWRLEHISETDKKIYDTIISGDISGALALAHQAQEDIVSFKAEQGIRISNYDYRKASADAETHFRKLLRSMESLFGSGKLANAKTIYLEKVRSDERFSKLVELKRKVLLYNKLYNNKETKEKIKTEADKAYKFNKDYIDDGNQYLYNYIGDIGTFEPIHLNLLINEYYDMFNTRNSFTLDGARRFFHSNMSEKHYHICRMYYAQFTGNICIEEVRNAYKNLLKEMTDEHKDVFKLFRFTIAKLVIEEVKHEKPKDTEEVSRD